MKHTTCKCKVRQHVARKIVITGGPGAGKTALLEMAKKNFCDHVAILPEAATIIFKGGFWRDHSLTSIRAAQRAIYHAQREMESMVFGDPGKCLILCDRGTLDGLAYWPDEENEFWTEVGSSKKEELLRYDVVIHLRTPIVANGYNHQNSVRIETPEEASVIDQRIEKVWKAHPHRFIIESDNNFLRKVSQAIELIKAEVPPCCRGGNS